MKNPKTAEPPLAPFPEPVASWDALAAFLEAPPKDALQRRAILEWLAAEMPHGSDRADRVADLLKGLPPPTPPQPPVDDAPPDPAGLRKQSPWFLRFMTGLNHAQEIQFFWKPAKPESRSACRLFLARTPPPDPEESGGGNPPAFEIRADPGDMKKVQAFLPLFNDPRDPDARPASFAADRLGYTVTLRFLREESGDSVEATVHGGRSAKGKPLFIRSTRVPDPVPQILYFWICLDWPADELGKVRLEAESFRR